MGECQGTSHQHAKGGKLRDKKRKNHNKNVNYEINIGIWCLS